MDEKGRIRQRVALVAISFLGLFGLVSLVSALINRDDSIPTEVISLPEGDRTTTLKVYGLEQLSTSKLSGIQVSHLQFELEEFIADQSENGVQYVTIESDSLRLRAGSPNEARFTITSSTGASYLVVGAYLTTNDMFVEIYTPDRSERIYKEHFDASD